MTKQFNNEDQIDHSLMPRFILVVEERYGGCYSHNTFTAWNYGIPITTTSDPHFGWCYGEPYDSSGGDYEAQEFWNNVRISPEKYPFYGGGSDIKQTVQDFLTKDPDRVYKELFQGIIQKDKKGVCKLLTFTELGI